MADIAGVNGQRTEFEVVGKPNLPGQLSYALATGIAKYGIDYAVDNMLFAKFLRSPYANATVKSVDVSKAKAIPGVVEVLTWEDPDIVNLGRRGGMMGGGTPPKAAPGGQGAGGPAASGPPAQGAGGAAPKQQGGGMGGPGGAKAAPPSPFKGLTPADLDMKGGNIIVKSDPSKSVPLAQAVRANLFATYSGRPPTSLWTAGMGKQLDTMNIAMCEVAVDTETGEVEILRFGVVADPGKIMPMTSLESQIHQVMDFTTGCQLLEDYFFDKQTGVKLNADMFEYKKTSMLDMPRVDMKLLETRVGNAAYGANGISHSLANTHLVICAIQNAIGKWIDPPATPDKVLKALGKA